MNEKPARNRPAPRPIRPWLDSAQLVAGWVFLAVVGVRAYGWQILAALPIIVAYTVFSIWIWRRARSSSGGWPKYLNALNVAAIIAFVLLGSAAQRPLCDADDLDCASALHQFPR